MSRWDCAASQVTLNGPLSFSDSFSGGPILDPAGYKIVPNVAFPDYSAFTVPTREMRPGYLQNWNLVLERQLRSDLLVRAAYVGSKGTCTYLLNILELNAAVYGSGPAPATSMRAGRSPGLARSGSTSRCPTPPTTRSSSRRKSATPGGLSILANYTLGKALDDGSGATGNPGPDPVNHHNNIGPADYDTKQRLVISAVWEMPRLKTSTAPIRWGGWQSNATYTASTGVPLTIRSGADNNYDGVTCDFGDYKGGDWQLSKDRPNQQQIARWFNTSVFASNAVGIIGTARRGQLRAMRIWTTRCSRISR